VILCPKIGRAIVLVREDQLSLAIGRRGQNVRLASKLCGWDIEIMTQEELEDQAVRAMEHFGQIEGVTDELADKLVGEGYLSYDDLSVIEPDELMALGGMTEEEVEHIVEQAEQKAEEAERAAADERRRQRDAEKHAPQVAEATESPTATDSLPEPSDAAPPDEGEFAASGGVESTEEDFPAEEPRPGNGSAAAGDDSQERASSQAAGEA
jgi:N utilization substance protein A